MNWEKVLEAMVYIGFSMFEVFTFFYLAFCLFRMKMKFFVKEVVITVVVMSLITYIMSLNPKLIDYNALTSPIFLILFLIFLFRIPVIDSIFIGILTFSILLSLQGVLIAMMDSIWSISLVEIQSTSMLMHSLQLFSDLIMITYGYILQKSRRGYEFVSDMLTSNFKTSAENIVICLLSIVTLVIIYLILSQSASVQLLACAVALIGWLYMAFARDNKFRRGTKV